MKSVIIVDKGVQDEEYIYPYYRLQEVGEVQVAVKYIGPEYKGKYGIPIKPTMATCNLNVDDFDLVIIPGGWESPEKVRQDKFVLDFLVKMNEQNKVIGAICHGPWVLASANICKGRNMTCYQGMKDDLVNAGAIYVDAPVVKDGNIITAPHYRDLPQFLSVVLKAQNENL